MKITLVAGARPNFMKLAPVVRALEKLKIQGETVSYRIVHTGQHFDERMSGLFFQQLRIPSADVIFSCGGVSDAEQIACIMTKFEIEIEQNRPDWVIVFGDVNSTLACAIVTKKQRIMLAHVEAGIRSGDMNMPEEINRMVTDSITDLFFTTSNQAKQNLIRLGVDANKIHSVGNTMIDTLLYEQDNLRVPDFWNKYQLDQRHYFLLTLHRQSNVNEQFRLKELLSNVQDAVPAAFIIFPIHPRTKKMLNEAMDLYPNIIAVEPQGYLEFVFLLKHCIGVITDSGGVTEEATVLGIPCITLRNTTERPETVTEGTNELVGNDINKIRTCMEMIYLGSWKKGKIPEYWDGKSAERITEILCHQFTLA